jgi:glycosyltransferase involved in cell wall biosynthesis
MEVNLIGAMKEDDKFIRQLTTAHSIDKNYLKIHAHVPHSIAVASLKRFDVLVLPSYADSNYIGMPLKLLEYLASGRIVIFGKSQLYKNMIPDNIKIFSYSPNNVNDLYESILDALNYEQLENLIISGIEFAETLTWENRTRKIISRAH